MAQVNFPLITRRRFALAVALAALGSRLLAADEAKPPEQPALNWSDIARGIVLAVVPRDYCDDKHWGNTDKVATGVRVRTKNGQVRLEQREKKVNNGLWRRVKVKLIDPEKNLKFEVRDLHKEDDGATHFQLFIEVRLKAESQFAVWAWGVKGINGTVESNMTVQGRADCSFVVETDRAEGAFLPEFVLKPAVETLHLKLTDVDTKRIGVINGKLAEELGDSSRKTVEDLLQDQEKKILKQVQKSLAKNQDRMKLDLGDWRKLMGSGEKSKK
jgi:hypothetical protein